MKPKYFRMDHGAVKLALLIVVLLGVLAIIGVDIAILAGAFGKTSPAVAGTSLAAAAIVGVATCLIIFNSGYRFDDGDIVVKLGFFKDRIKYDALTKVKFDEDNRVLYLLMGDEYDGTSVRVNIQKKFNDDFMKALRERVPNIAVEYFTLPPKKEEK